MKGILFDFVSVRTSSVAGYLGWCIIEGYGDFMTLMADHMEIFRE